MKTSHIVQWTGALALAAFFATAAPQANAAPIRGYEQINLVADQAGQARFTDTNLVNPWGFVISLGDLLVVPDNGMGVMTFYGPLGRPAPLVVTIPSPAGPGVASAPTHLEFSFSGDFVVTNEMDTAPSLVLFVTEDGTIGGWNPELSEDEAFIAVDNSPAGAVYKSLALGHTRNGPVLFAANFHEGFVEKYDQDFQFVKSFTDTNLLNIGFAPFGMRNIAGHLVVTFAKQKPDKHDDEAGPGNGYVDIFDLNGNLVRRFASQGTLNSPWGLAQAPPNFGSFAGALLVGNFGDGAVNAFNPRSGAFLGQLRDPQGQVILIDGLWGLNVPPGPPAPTLYFTSGPDSESHGLLGILRPDNRGNARRFR